MSGGYEAETGLSCALIHKPNILFLDEPTTGVDPVSRKEFWQMLRNLREQGITIVVSTPIMDEPGNVTGLLSSIMDRFMALILPNVFFINLRLSFALLPWSGRK